MKSIYNSYLNDDLAVFSKTLRKYDFIDFDPTNKSLIDLWDVSVKFADSEKLESNGSTLTNEEKYRFGPMSVLFEVEKILKYKNYHTIFVTGNNQGRNQLIKSKNPLHNQVFYFDYKTPNWEDLIVSIRGRYKTVIKASPHTFLWLTSDDDFLSILQSYDKQIHSLCTSDGEPFFRKKNLTTLVNNNMINWKTGVNFYTCESGFLHFLPLFFLEDANAINMLNMANKRKYYNDDLFYYEKSPITCKCGNVKLDFSITAHCDNKFRAELDLIEELKDKYCNLQFVKEEQKIKVYFTTVTNSMSEYDQNIIKNRFENVEFIENIRLQTGLSKYYSFWQASSRTIASEFSL